MVVQGECNDVPGMFPEAFVERLFGADPPTSKETLLFQATCLYEEAGERRLQLLDALTQPDKHTGRIPKSLSMQLDDKFYFVEYAKKVRARATGNLRVGLGAAAPHTVVLALVRSWSPVLQP